MYDKQAVIDAIWEALGENIADKIDGKVVNIMLKTSSVMPVIEQYYAKIGHNDTNISDFLMKRYGLWREDIDKCVDNFVNAVITATDRYEKYREGIAAKIEKEK